MSRNSDSIPISEAIKTFIETHELKEGIDQVRIKDIWKEVMGCGVNSYTTAIHLRKDTLVVSLSSSVLREELSYGKEKIITILNEALGKTLIKTLYLR